MAIFLSLEFSICSPLNEHTCMHFFFFLQYSCGKSVFQKCFLDHKSPDTNRDPAIFETFSISAEAKLKLLIYGFRGPIHTRLTHGTHLWETFKQRSAPSCMNQNKLDISKYQVYFTIKPKIPGIGCTVVTQLIL